MKIMDQANGYVVIYIHPIKAPFLFTEQNKKVTIFMYKLVMIQYF